MERKHELALWARGLLRVAGVDEAGIGPLAGPVVAAAVILPPHCSLPGVDDSKKLTARQRASLCQPIKDAAVAWCVAQASRAEIDQINIYHAGLLAMRRAVEGLATPPQHALVDGRTVSGLPCPETRVVGGDARELSIAAASVLAKVHRDHLMDALDARFPVYGFAKHKGYPTPAHRAALMAHGPCEEHRLSFAPVQTARGGLGETCQTLLAALDAVRSAADLDAWALALRGTPGLSPIERRALHAAEVTARRRVSPSQAAVSTLTRGGARR